MIVPLGSQVVVLSHIREKSGGIILPDKRVEREWELEVIATGPDVIKVVKGQYIYCKPMDIVFLNNWIGENPLTGFVMEEKILGVRK